MQYSMLSCINPGYYGLIKFPLSRQKLFFWINSANYFPTAESYLKLTMRVGLRINGGVFRPVAAGRRAKNSNLEQ